MSPAPAARALDPFVELAHALADAAGPIVARHFRTGATIVDKPDLSPVTVADRDAEAAMRALIAKRMPEAGILGEEMGPERVDAEYVWVLDPIDGTKSFVTGKPLFGTLIALTHQGEPVVGVIDQPVLKERWVGIAGRPSTFNGQPIRTRACERLSDAWLYATTPAMFEGSDSTAWKRLSMAVKFPVYGADCYAYGMLSCGWTDLVCEAQLKPYDWCALVPVVEGAGGKITDWSGGKLGLEPVGRVLASGDPRLHDAALALLNG